jgi:hypothetical protein
MSSLIISGVTNHINDRSEAESFDAILVDYKRMVRGLPDILKHDILKVYINFQYDCEGLPAAIKGIRLDRYSKKERQLGADIEVKRAVFAALGATERRKMLGRLTLDALGAIENKYGGKMQHNLRELSAALVDLNTAFEKV